MSQTKPIALQEPIIVNVKSRQIGNLIKRAINEAEKVNGRKWTQLSLADVTKIDKDVLNKMINGKSHIEMTHLTLIAKTLSVAFRFSIPNGQITINIDESASVLIEPSVAISDIMTVRKKEG